MFCLCFIFQKELQTIKIKKIICLHYAGLSDIFNIGETIGMIYTLDGKPPLKIKREANYNGSFYDQKSIDILNHEADMFAPIIFGWLTPRFYKILFASEKKFSY